MKQLELAKWLKSIIIVAAVIGLVLCCLIIPSLGKDAVLLNPTLDYMFWPCLIFIWITAIPLYITLGKSWIICCEISNDNYFCKENADRFKSISKLALVECILYLAAVIILVLLGLLYLGILLIALFIIFIGISIAVASATLSHFVEKASALKEENDLTI